jgi:hypothetical protein
MKRTPIFKPPTAPPSDSGPSFPTRPIPQGEYYVLFCVYIDPIAGHDHE